MARFLEDSGLARRVADSRQVMSLPFRCSKHEGLETSLCDSHGGDCMQCDVSELSIEARYNKSCP